MAPQQPKAMTHTRAGALAPSVRGSALAALTWLVVALSLLLTTTALSQDLSLEDQRQVEALTEQIRMLHSEQRYNEVIQTANRLLTIDPNNSAGIIWRDRAQLRIQGPPPRPDRLIELREPPERSRSAALLDVSSVDAGDFVPVPLSPRTRSSVIATPSSLPPWVMWAVVILLLLVVLIILTTVVLRMRSSQREIESRVAEVVTRADQTGHGLGGIHDEVTRAPGIRDEDSVMQFGEVGRGPRASDEDTAPPTVRPAAKSAAAQEDEQTFVELENFDANDDLQGGEESISLDFGGFEDDNKKGDTGFNSLMFDDVEEKPKAAPTADLDENEQTFNSLMFGSADETQVPSAPPKKAPQDADEQTFNSMMFGGEDTNVGAGESEEISLGDPLGLAPGLDGDPDDTNILGSSQSGVQRFEHQKEVGLTALATGDYKLAVQSLTLAQALRPEDAEVNAKLEEAKKLRDQA